MQAISRKALPLPATPKGVTTLWAMKWAFIYVKRAKTKTVSYRRPYGSQSTEWPMQAISREALPLPATPKGVTTWVYLIKSSKAKGKTSST